MTLDQFKNEHLGDPLDYDKAFGAQCVDLINYYARDVVGSPTFRGNAKDIINQNPGGKYVRVNSPQKGDIAVYPATKDNGFYGHIAIMLNSRDSLDQNYPTGSKVAVRRHSEKPVGYLRPKGNVQVKPEEAKKLRAENAGLRKALNRANYALATQAGYRFFGKLLPDSFRRRFLNYVTPTKVVDAVKKWKP